MREILTGIETEYGISISGRGPTDQVGDARRFVSSYPNPCFVGWDSRFEAPRKDLRGFQVAQLNVDPVDAAFDLAPPELPASDLRADRVLANGARFYNDHGHPEYATPEAFSPRRVAELDREGESHVWQTARAFGSPVKLYKNNTDFHGASYGTHESYLVPRALGFESLFNALVPLLVARIILCGAGKVGSEAGAPAAFQLMQRADFFSELASVDTLFRRPLFNTRDEPHADADQWIRLHVIATDANRIVQATARKIGLMHLGIALAETGWTPSQTLADPIAAIQSLSRDLTFAFPVTLQGGGHSTAQRILEEYFDAAESRLNLTPELAELVQECRVLLDALDTNWGLFKSRVDWAAKYHLISEYREEENLDWADPALIALDLGYADLDPEASLFDALVEMGEVVAPPAPLSIPNDSRAVARGHAVTHFGTNLVSASWSRLTFDVDGKIHGVDLRPECRFDAHALTTTDVELFIQSLKGN